MEEGFVVRFKSDKPQMVLQVIEGTPSVKSYVVEESSEQAPAAASGGLRAAFNNVAALYVGCGADSFHNAVGGRAGSRTELNKKTVFNNSLGGVAVIFDVLRYVFKLRAAFGYSVDDQKSAQIFHFGRRRGNDSQGTL